MEVLGPGVQQQRQPFQTTTKRGTAAEVAAGILVLEIEIGIEIGIKGTVVATGAGLHGVGGRHIRAEVEVVATVSSSRRVGIIECVSFMRAVIARKEHLVAIFTLKLVIVVSKRGEEKGRWMNNSY